MRTGNPDRIRAAGSEIPARTLKAWAINPGAETDQRIEGHLGYPGA